jgi:hypothetical protein
MRYFDERDPVIRLKLSLMQRAFPARDVIVFGDMYGVEGAYTERCLSYGADRVVLIDAFETPGWLETRKAHPRIDFYKGDFSDPFFMQSIRQSFSTGIAYDVLLHQAPVISTLHLILDKVRDKFCFAQPMIKEQKFQNTLIYLPGSTDIKELHPNYHRNDVFNAFDPYRVNVSAWIWAMTPSFVISVLKGEGFEVTYQDFVEGVLPNKNWIWWGCVAERRLENSQHWSKVDYRQVFGIKESLFTGSWSFGNGNDSFHRFRHAITRIARFVSKKKS